MSKVFCGVKFFLVQIVGVKLKGVKLEYFIICRGKGINVGVRGKMFET